VRGGQKTYLDINGALAFTGAGPAGGLPSGAIYPLITTITQDGYASPPAGFASWYTCPLQIAGPQQFRIYAAPSNQYCVKSNLKVIDVADSVVGAYLYS